MRGNEKEHKSFLPHYAKLGTVVRWGFIYPDTRDLGASVNGRFFRNRLFKRYFVLASHISDIWRSESGWSVFTIKHGHSINFASFYRRVNFNGTPINTIEILRLSIEFHSFLPASLHE